MVIKFILFPKRNFHNVFSLKLLGGSRHLPKSGEKPSEEQVEKLEEKLEAAQADQKNLFLIIFQVCIFFYVLRLFYI